jgi:hypothetical protein
MGHSSGVYSLIGVEVGAPATGAMQYAMAARRSDAKSALRNVS